MGTKEGGGGGEGVGKKVDFLTEEEEKGEEDSFLPPSSQAPLQICTFGTQKVSKWRKAKEKKREM